MVSVYEQLRDKVKELEKSLNEQALAHAEAVVRAGKAEARETYLTSQLKQAIVQIEALERDLEGGTQDE